MPDDERVPRLWLLIGAIALVEAVVLLQWMQPLHWDEIEFFRATRWIAEGRVPFRDYWEHHLPLQWMLFAPVAAVFSDGAGVQAVLALRWAQLPLWTAVFFIVHALMQRAGIATRARWMAMALLLASVWFAGSAIRYRVDVVGHAAYLAALGLWIARASRRSAFVAGVLWATAVLANMRLAPLVIVTAIVLMLWRGAEERWGWNGRALWMIGGGAVTAGVFVAVLRMTGAWAGFLDGVLWYNTTTDRMLPPEAKGFFLRTVVPLLPRDLAGIAFAIAAIEGLVLVLRNFKKPGAVQIFAILGVASLISTALLGIQYEYHFQIAALLFIPVVAQVRHTRVVTIVLAACALCSLAISAATMSRTGLAFQDRVMHEVDARTTDGDRVWDPVGYALRREPAYRYWFLAAGVRFLADAHRIDEYDIEAHPPAAIVFNDRTRSWMRTRPQLTAFATRNYVPLYQSLWIPGFSATLAPHTQTMWTVTRAGTYDVHASELLLRHPWFTRPLDYGVMQGVALDIPLAQLPNAPGLQWRVNGISVDSSKPLTLAAGDRVEVLGGPAPAGVLVVPHGIATLSITPETPFAL